jgi:hypothetical protein
MFTKRFNSCAVSVLGLIAAAGFSHAAPAAASQPCVFAKYAPTAVSQYVVDSDLDYSTYDVLKGAQLYVPAREGLTREWLELSIQRALEQHDDSKSSDVACHVPKADRIQVKVASAGNGYWVTLVTADASGAKELLQWASQVVKEHRATLQSTRASTK